MEMIPPVRFAALVQAGDDIDRWLQHILKDETDSRSMLTTIQNLVRLKEESRPRGMDYLSELRSMVLAWERPVNPYSQPPFLTKENKDPGDVATQLRQETLRLLMQWEEKHGDKFVPRVVVTRAGHDTDKAVIPIALRPEGRDYPVVVYLAPDKLDGLDKPGLYMSVSPEPLVKAAAFMLDAESQKDFDNVEAIKMLRSYIRWSASTSLMQVKLGADGKVKIVKKAWDEYEETPLLTYQGPSPLVTTITVEETPVIRWVNVDEKRPTFSTGWRNLASAQ